MLDEEVGPERGGGRGMKLKEYVERHPHLKEVLEKVKPYLPSLPEDAEVVLGLPASFDPQVVKGVTLPEERKVHFAEDPPQPHVFIHELIHLCGILDEVDDTIVHNTIGFAIKLGLRPFDATKVLGLRFEDVEEAVRELGFESIEDFFQFHGILMTDVCELIEEGGELKMRFKEGVPENLVVKRVLTDLLAGLEYPETFPLYVEVFVKLVEKIGGGRA